MSTLQTIIDEARVLLNDDDKVRYSDARLLSYANQALAEARRVRPDLFLGSFGSGASTYVLTDTSPLPLEYEPYLQDYIVGRSNSRDDEYTLDGRATAFIVRFKSGLLSV